MDRIITWMYFEKYVNAHIPHYPVKNYIIFTAELEMTGHISMAPKFDQVHDMSKLRSSNPRNYTLHLPPKSSAIKTSGYDSFADS